MDRISSSSAAWRSRSRRPDAVVADRTSSSSLSRCLALPVFGCTRALRFGSSLVSSYVCLLLTLSRDVSLSEMLIFFICVSIPGFGILLSFRTSGGGLAGRGGDSGRGSRDLAPVGRLVRVGSFVLTATSASSAAGLLRRLGLVCPGLAPFFFLLYQVSDSLYG